MISASMSETTSCQGQFGRLLGPLGGSRGFNRIPRILLLILVWLKWLKHALWTKIWTISMLC